LNKPVFDFPGPNATRSIASFIQNRGQILVTIPSAAVNQDRNTMQYDRRKHPRIKVTLSARWEGVLQGHEATVTSLSLGGCFVLSGGKVVPKELVRLEIDLPNESSILLWAEVVEEAYEIGFSAQFTSVSDDDAHSRLQQFVDSQLSLAS